MASSPSQPEYTLEIYEWSGSSWEPYIADDVQLQFYMLSPYVLTTMSSNAKVPDVYGVFQFKLEYQRLGYTSLSLAKQIKELSGFTVTKLFGD